MQKQKEYQQVQIKQDVFHYHPEDVVAAVKKPNINTLNN